MIYMDNAATTMRKPEEVIDRPKNERTRLFLQKMK